MPSFSALFAGLTALSLVPSALAIAPVCTQSPYASILPVSDYAPAMSFCSSEYPAPVVTSKTTVTPATTVTVYTTQRTTFLTTTTKVIPVKSTTTVATVTAKARRSADPIPQKGPYQSLASVWDSFTQNNGPSKVKQACYCIETPSTTTSTFTATKTKTVKTTSTITMATTKLVVVKSTSTQVIPATATVTAPLDPNEPCKDGQIIVSNGKRYLQKCKTSALLKPDTNGYGWSTTSTVGTSRACTNYCASVGNCCSAVITLDDTSSYNCRLTYNSNGCQSYTTQSEAYDVISDQQHDSAVYLGLTNPPKKPVRSCTEGAMKEYPDGRKYQQLCNKNVVPQYFAVSSRFGQNLAVATNADCGSVCANWGNCCTAVRQDKAGVATCDIWYQNEGSCPEYPESKHAYNITTNQQFADSWVFAGIAEKPEPEPEPPTRTCTQGQIIVQNDRKFEQQCGNKFDIPDPTAVGVFIHEITEAPYNQNIKSCARNCADQRSCCLASQYHDLSSGMDICKNWHNETGQECNLPINWFKYSTEDEAPATDSAIFVGEVDNGRGCTRDAVYELNGKRYQPMCKRHAFFWEQGTMVQDLSDMSPEIDSAEGCARWCAEKTNCCVAYLMETERGRQCWTKGSTNGCVEGTEASDIYHSWDDLESDSMVYLGPVA